VQIIKRTGLINGCEVVEYVYNGKEYKELSKLLASEFHKQGEFYEKILGVSWDDAEIAEWHPEDEDFCRDCDGWKKMLADGGRIRKSYTEEVINVRDLLNIRS